MYHSGEASVVCVPNRNFRFLRHEGSQLVNLLHEDFRRGTWICILAAQMRTLVNALSDTTLHPDELLLFKI